MVESEKRANVRNALRTSDDAAITDTQSWSAASNWVRLRMYIPVYLYLRSRWARSRSSDERRKATSETVAFSICSDMQNLLAITLCSSEIILKQLTSALPE
jgi:hypothetical protein